MLYYPPALLARRRGASINHGQRHYWLLAYKHAYHPHIAHFIEFCHECSATYDIHTCHFSWVELFLIQLDDIQRYVVLQAHNDPCYSMNPLSNHRPKFCCPSNLKSIIKTLSHCMPHRTVPSPTGTAILPSQPQSTRSSRRFRNSKCVAKAVRQVSSGPPGRMNSLSLSGCFMSNPALTASTSTPPSNSGSTLQQAKWMTVPT